MQHVLLWKRIFAFLSSVFWLINRFSMLQVKNWLSVAVFWVFLGIIFFGLETCAVAVKLARVQALSSIANCRSWLFIFSHNSALLTRFRSMKFNSFIYATLIEFDATASWKLEVPVLRSCTVVFDPNRLIINNCSTSHKSLIMFDYMTIQCIIIWIFKCSEWNGRL